VTHLPKSTPPAGRCCRPNVKRSANGVRLQTNEERRRAQRVHSGCRRRVYRGQSQSIHGTTHTVSASGAMIILPQGLPTGTKISIENPKTQKKVEAHVVRPPVMNAEGSLVPIEFTTPSPQFWNVFFPPNPNN